MAQLNANLWNEDSGIYVNKDWQKNTWYKNDNGSAVLAPTNFYPMLAGAPSDAQVEKMMARWLSNATEFSVRSGQTFGMPSVSRSNSMFKDNNYWRGRSWGPMNMLVYLGLREY